MVKTLMEYSVNPFFTKKLVSKKDIKSLRQALGVLAMIPGVNIRKMSMAFGRKSSVALEDILSYQPFIKPLRRSNMEWGIITGSVLKVMDLYLSRQRVNAMRRIYFEHHGVSRI